MSMLWGHERRLEIEREIEKNTPEKKPKIQEEKVFNLPHFGEVPGNYLLIPQYLLGNTICDYTTAIIINLLTHVNSRILVSINIRLWGRLDKNQEPAIQLKNQTKVFEGKDICFINPKTMGFTSTTYIKLDFYDTTIPPMTQ